jgi:hypothetical protein
MKPMRMLVLLAVFWAAGSLLLAAESPTTPAPKPAAEVRQPEAAAPKKTEDESKTDSKADTKEGPKGSIAEQAEAALKAAAEADGSAASEPPESEAETAAKDDTQAPPASSAGKGPSPQRFVPSEQVRADFDVSFPIDI